jgi:hypothetical protein
LFAAVTAVPIALLGQEKSQAPAAPANPMTASEKGIYGFVSNTVIGAAQKMSEEKLLIRSPNTKFAIWSVNRPAGDNPDFGVIEKAATASRCIHLRLQLQLVYETQF